MVPYVLKRLTATVPVLFVVSVIVFGALRLLPSDPVDALFPPTASVSEETRRALRRQLGLNQPLYVQYAAWLGLAVQGNFGYSLRSREPVSTLVAQRAPETFALVALSTLLGCAIALPIGVLAALKRDTPIDYSATTLALFGLSIPAFAFGTVLALVFGVWLRWLPTIGHPALPVITQGLIMAGILVRNVRSGVLDQLGQDYVRTARGKGVAPSLLQVRHVLPNALPTTLSVLANSVGYALGGAIVVEQIFAWPGIGLLLFEAISSRDYAVVQGTVLLTAAAFIFVNLVADLARALIDPRIREAR